MYWLRNTTMKIIWVLGYALFVLQGTAMPLESGSLLSEASPTASVEQGLGVNGETATSRALSVQDSTIAGKSAASILNRPGDYATCTTNSSYSQVVLDADGAKSSCGQVGVYANRCAVTCTSTTPVSASCTNVDGSSIACGRYGVYAGSCQSYCGGRFVRKCAGSCIGNSGASISCGTAGFACVAGAQQIDPSCADSCTFQSVWHKRCSSSGGLTNCQGFGVYDKTSTARYNQVQATSSHNSFDAETYGKTTLGAILDTGVRSLEIDVHTVGANVNDWPVYHVTTGSNCGGWLSTCLDKVKTWHNAHPRHEVITLFIDGQDDPLFNYPVSTFESLLSSRLGTANIYKPADLIAGKNVGNLRAAVAAPFGWPTLKELRGRFIVVLTGGGRHEYMNVAGSWPTERIAFVASELQSGSDPITTDNNIIFFNIGSCSALNPHCGPESDNFSSALQVWNANAGYVSRIFRLNSTQDARDAIHSKAQFMATNQYKDDVYKTKTVRGYPFQCVNRMCDTSTWVEDLAP